MVYEAYNLTAMGNTTGIVDLIQTVNSNLMFDFFGIGLILSIFLITFFAFNRATDNASKALAAASFISFGLSMLLMILELIPNYIMYLALILAAIAAITIKER